MDTNTRISAGERMRPLPLSPQSSYTVQKDKLSNQKHQNEANDKQMKHRSCLPGYPIQRSSTSNSVNEKTSQPQPRTASMSRSNPRGVDTVLTDDVFMMDHLASAPSLSMPIHSSLLTSDNHDLYHRRNGHQLLPSRGHGTPQRRSRNATSSISRSATAALATPRSSSTSRARSSTYFKNHHTSSQQPQHSNSSASTGSRYNYPNGTTTSTSPTKRSSSRISFSSQLSSTTTAPSIHDIDDIGTVSSRRSESSLNHRQSNNHQKPPSPLTGANATFMRKSRPPGKDFSSNQSIGSTTTKSSSGTNTMGNTKAISNRRIQKSALSPSHALRTNNAIKTAEVSSAMTSQSEAVDGDTKKHHAQETRRIMDGKCYNEAPIECMTLLTFITVVIAVLGFHFLSNANAHFLPFKICIDPMELRTNIGA